MQRKRRVITQALLLSGLLAATFMHAQKEQQESAHREQFVLVRLSDGKPMPNKHLVIFVGSTVEEARRHSRRIDINTNSGGIATLALLPSMSWFQAWHAVTKTCEKEIRGDEVFHGNVLFDEGIIVMDTCGAGLERLQPYFPNLAPIVHLPAKPN